MTVIVVAVCVAIFVPVAILSFLSMRRKHGIEDIEPLPWFWTEKK